jgi:hypothetical protein
MVLWSKEGVSDLSDENFIQKRKIRTLDQEAVHRERLLRRETLERVINVEVCRKTYPGIYKAMNYV